MPLDYDVHPRATPLSWLCLHGYSDRDRFPDDCRLEQYASTAYLKAPRRLLNHGFGWMSRDVRDLLETMPAIARGLRQDYEPSFVLAGHSDAAREIHCYARELLRAGWRIVCLVHYAGFFRPEDKAPVPCVACRNDAEPFDRIREDVALCAREYGTEPLILDQWQQRHRWDWHTNPQIIEAVRERTAENADC